MRGLYTRQILASGSEHHSYGLLLRRVYRGKGLTVVGVSRVYKVGPRKVTKLSKGAVGIYLPAKLKFLAGKHVMLTIEVLEEDSNDA